MRSARPKPLHRLCGRPMILHVIDALSQLQLDRVVVVVGHGAERVTKSLQGQIPRDINIEFVEQATQRGTGDAVAVGLTAFADDDDDDEADVIVLPGDTPLLRPQTLAALFDAHDDSGAAATVLTARLDDPAGYGRIVRGRDDRVSAVVEHNDADDEERLIEEVNTSIYCFRRGILVPSLRRLSPENSQGEYYLGDVIGVLHNAGYRVSSLEVDDSSETSGVNDRLQLANAEDILRRRINDSWLKRGVTMLDPLRTSVDCSVELAPDVTLLPGTLLQGNTTVAQGAEIGPNTHLVDCVVDQNARVEQTTARSAHIGANAHVGPYAYLAAGSAVAAGVSTGPFFSTAIDQ